MEPLSALGVATAIVQFLDFTGKVVAGTYKIHTAKSGTETTLQDVTTSLKRVNRELRENLPRTSPRSWSSHEQDIFSLGKACDDLGERLLSTLATIQESLKDKYENGVVVKVQDRPSAYGSFRAALRTVWKQSTIDTLCRDLESYRSQISLLILASLQEQAVFTAKAHDENFKETKSLCQQILTHLDGTGEWRNDSTLGSGNYRLPKESHELPSDGFPGENINARVQKLILDSLRFQEIDDRYERISIAYQKTFEWIYTKSAIADFPAWLRSPDASLYWITGKPGSGKSTLMKYVFNHDMTRRELKASALGKQLILVSAYLWNSGTQLQMSYEGLVQSLLYQILRAKPALTQLVFPHWFEAGLLLGECIKRAERMVWIWEELNKAFYSALKEAIRRHKLVLFIDGLDEFAGKPSEIIEFVTTLMSFGVKVCAAGRPWVVFEDAFGSYPHLRVQDLTQGDIKYYVTSQLEGNEGFRVTKKVYPDICANLVESVWRKSSGVWLWVTLVTRSLLEGLTDGENGTELQARLDSLPEDLEHLFWKILKGLDARNYPRACQLFKIHRCSQSTLTLLDLSFADNLDGDSDFALNAQFGPWNESKKNARADLMRRRMNACCKGLLEASDTATKHSSQAEINYLHRTVKDFLEQADVWSEICRAAGPDFDQNASLYDAQLMRLKISVFDTQTIKNIWETILLGILYAIQAEDDGSRRQVQLLDGIDEVTGKSMNAALAKGVSIHNAQGRDSYWIAWRSKGTTQSSFLEFAVRLRLLGYVSACLQALPKTQSRVEASHLLHTAVTSNGVSELGLANVPEVFRYESIDQNTIQLLLGYADPNWESADGTTAWTKLLERPNLDQLIDIAKDFLDAGANPRHPLFDDPDFKSQLPEAFKAIVKQKRRSTRWSHYFGSSITSNR